MPPHLRRLLDGLDGMIAQAEASKARWAAAGDDRRSAALAALADERLTTLRTSRAAALADRGRHQPVYQAAVLPPDGRRPDMPTDDATETLAQIERTIVGLEARLDDSGRYVRIADGRSSWWQPVERLLPLLRAMPDHRLGGDEQDEADAYADWRRATEPAGFFGHNTADDDTMAVPADFRGAFPA
jgi:hypothetical protein